MRKYLWIAVIALMPARSISQVANGYHGYDLPDAEPVEEPTEPTEMPEEMVETPTEPEPTEMPANRTGRCPDLYKS